MDVRGKRQARERTRIFAMVVVAGVIPFWATVAAFDPLGRLLPTSEPAARLVRTQPFPPFLPPQPCERLQQQRQQSLGDCTLPMRARPRGLGPGDFPHQPPRDGIADHPGIPQGRGGS